MCWVKVWHAVSSATDYLPFVLAAGDKRRPKMDLHEIVKTLTIVGLTTLATMQIQENKIGGLENNLITLSAEIKEMKVVIDETNKQIVLIRIKQGQ